MKLRWTCGDMHGLIDMGECDTYEEWRYCTPAEVVSAVKATAECRTRIGTPPPRADRPKRRGK